jgi:hypothetical protein
MRILFCFFIFLVTLFPIAGQTAQTRRSFDKIFPEIPSVVREAAFSKEGFNKSSERIQSSALVGSGQNAIEPQIVEAIFQKQPRFLVESILVIPGKTDEYSLLDIYNALGKVRGLKGKRYHSYTRNEYVPLFEDVTRIVSPQRNTAIPDPAPATAIPPSETIYMRLKDVNFGNTYYRGNVTLAQHGLRYSLSNNKNITYLFIPVIKEEKFSVQLYFEPIVEGVLIYALAGADISDFMSSRVNMASAISKRLAVIISWVVEGITGNADA